MAARSASYMALRKRRFPDRAAAAVRVEPRISGASSGPGRTRTYGQRIMRLRCASRGVSAGRVNSNCYAVSATSIPVAFRSVSAGLDRSGFRPFDVRRVSVGLVAPVLPPTR